MPDALFAEVYGKYVPRLTVDTIVTFPNCRLSAVVDGLHIRFVRDSAGPDLRVALAKRDIPPQFGTWHMPGGTVYRGETVEEAARRHVRHDLGVEIDILTSLPHMEFPAEHRHVDIDGELRELAVDSISVVLLARALSHELHGSAEGRTVGWFANVPPSPHPKHIQYLLQYGLLHQ